MKEYKTTLGKWQYVEQYSEYGNYHEPDAVDPIPPEGQGWELVGSTASDKVLFWFWARNLSEEAK